MKERGRRAQAIPKFHRENSIFQAWERSVAQGFARCVHIPPTPGAEAVS